MGFALLGAWGGLLRLAFVLAIPLYILFYIGLSGMAVYHVGLLSQEAINQTLRREIFTRPPIDDYEVETGLRRLSFDAKLRVVEQKNENVFYAVVTTTVKNETKWIYTEARFKCDVKIYDSSRPDTTTHTVPLRIMPGETKTITADIRISRMGALNDSPMIKDFMCAPYSLKAVTPFEDWALGE